MTRRMFEHIVAALEHFGEEIALESMSPPEIAGIIGEEEAGKYVEEVEQLSDRLRHALGAALQDARRLRDLYKYGANHFREQSVKNMEKMQDE